MMTKKLLLAALAVSGLAATTAAQSQSAEDSGFYFGGGIGRATLKADFGDTFTLDDWDTAWRAIVGYKLNKYVAFQAEYIDSGTQQQQTRGGIGTTVDVQGTHAVASILGILPINDTFSVYAKVGYDFYDAKFQAVTRAIQSGVVVAEIARVNFKESGEDLLYGAGVRVTRDAFSFDLAYEILDVDFDAGDNWKFNMLSASATYKF